jgi:aminopeptidase N
LESVLPGENLTRQEAELRSDLLSVHSYEIALDLTTDEKTFRSETTVRFSANQVGANTFIDAITAQVHSVVLNGRSLNVSEVSDGVRIHLSNLDAENELTVVSDAFFMNTGEGLHRFVDPADDEVYLYTQFEVPDSRRVFAVFEQPSLKATFQFTITAPARWKVVSNQATPTPTPIEDDKAVWRFEPTPVISSYITALIAGPYSEVRSELTSSDGRVIPIGVFARASMTEFLDADYIFDKTREGFAFFEKAFDYPYPFDKYDQLFVPEFNAGAMENAGAVTFTETYVFRSKVTDAIRERRVITILHELAHMWFGDLVTMQWWNDLWLNESFAEYASHLAVAEATEWKNTWSTFASLEKSWAFRQDQLPSTHPIVAEINDLEDVQVNFDGITYAKGAAVLKQLVAWVGQDKFLAGVSEYFKQHAFKNTQLKDLLTELEKTSGRELKSWSKLWLETAGVNTLRPEMSVSENGTITHFVIEQTAIESQPTIRPHRMAIGFYDLHDGKLTRTSQIELDVDGPRTHVSQLVGLKQPALILLNDGDLAYAKIRLDKTSWATALEHLSEIEDPLARTIVWGAAVDASRDAEADPADLIRLVLTHIATETESTTMMTLLRQLVTTGNLYINAADRQKALSQIADGLLVLARSAKAGSDSQLQFTKFFALFARSESQLQALKNILLGIEALPGLTIDADLKWELLTGLVVAGAAGEEQIAELVSIDKTANGEKAAAGARAAIPTAENKAAMWRLLTETKELSNAHVQSASLAFNRVIDTELLRPYVQKYFDSALAIWELHTFKIAEYLLVNLFPIQLADESTANAAREAIADPKFTAIPALHRILVENLDNLERALRVQTQSK